MELVIKSAALALVALVLAVFLHRYSPGLAPLTALCACMLLLFWLIPQLSALVSAAGNLAAQAGLSREELLPLCKVMGVAICTPADIGTVPGQWKQGPGRSGGAVRRRLRAFVRSAPGGTGPGAVGSHLKKKGGAMEKLCLLLLLLPLLILPVRGAGLEEVRDQMPESVQEVTTDLGDSMVSSSSRSLLGKGVGLWRQHLRESCKASLSILAVCVLLGLGQSFAGASGITLPGNLLSMVGVCAVALIALAGTGSLLTACQESLEEMDALLKGMMPAFVSAMAASGNPVSSVMASSATLMGAGLLLSLGKNLVFPRHSSVHHFVGRRADERKPHLAKGGGFSPVAVFCLLQNSAHRLYHVYHHVRRHVLRGRRRSGESGSGDHFRGGAGAGVHFV